MEERGFVAGAIVVCKESDHRQSQPEGERPAQRLLPVSESAGRSHCCTLCNSSKRSRATELSRACFASPFFPRRTNNKRRETSTSCQSRPYISEGRKPKWCCRELDLLPFPHAPRRPGFAPGLSGVLLTGGHAPLSRLLWIYRRLRRAVRCCPDQRSDSSCRRILWIAHHVQRRPHPRVVPGNAVLARKFHK